MSGDTLFHEGADLMSMVDGEPGLVAICAPPGTVSAAAPFAPSFEASKQRLRSAC